MKTIEMVNIINCLTPDEDEQQELWVSYLENRDIFTLSDHLFQIRKRYSEEDLLQVTVWKHMKNSLDRDLHRVFDQFSDLEQSVIRLLLLGCELHQISSIKGIGLVRLRHIIAVIKENPIWKELENE